jgi:hypothetical protein
MSNILCEIQKIVHAHPYKDPDAAVGKLGGCLGVEALIPLSKTARGISRILYPLPSNNARGGLRERYEILK